MDVESLRRVLVRNDVSYKLEKIANELEQIRRLINRSPEDFPPDTDVTLYRLASIARTALAEYIPTTLPQETTS